MPRQTQECSRMLKMDLEGRTMNQLDIYFKGVPFPSLKRPFITLLGLVFQGRGFKLSYTRPSPGFTPNRLIASIGKLGSVGRRQRWKLSVLKMLERFHYAVITPEVVITRIAPMSSTCGKRNYQIFSAFGSFPAVTCQSTT